MNPPGKTNPYWHPHNKPHIFEPDKVDELCLVAFEVFSTSLAIENYWVDDTVDSDEEPGFEYPRLVAKHQKDAEAKIASTLMILAITYRALEDQLEGDEGFRIFKTSRANTFEGKLTYHVGQGGTTLREACNKVIHTEDFRPVYDNGSMPRDEGVWGMDGRIELEGARGGKVWQVQLGLLDFLEAMADIADFVRTLDAN